MVKARGSACKPHGLRPFYENRLREITELRFVIPRNILPLLAGIMSVACVLAGCQSPKAVSLAGGGAAREIRNNCYSLLHQLLEDQKNVGKLRFIKREEDRKSTRLNSSHSSISYAVFCLKKKKFN